MAGSALLVVDGADEGVGVTIEEEEEEEDDASDVVAAGSLDAAVLGGSAGGTLRLAGDASDDDDDDDDDEGVDAVAVDLLCVDEGEEDDVMDTGGVNSDASAGPLATSSPRKGKGALGTYVCSWPPLE